MYVDRFGAREHNSWQVPLAHIPLCVYLLQLCARLVCEYIRVYSLIIYRSGFGNSNGNSNVASVAENTAVRFGPPEIG